MPTVRELVNRYLELREAEFQAGRLGAKLMERFHRMLGDFASHYGTRDASTIRPSDVRVWILSHRSWVADHTRLNAARSVVSMFRWAED
jgi:hypothetical protein